MVVFLSMVIGNIQGQNWNKISKRIRKEQLSRIPLENKMINSYYVLRKESRLLQRMNLPLVGDTVFVLQTHRVPEADFYSLSSMIWNRIDTLSVGSNDSGKTFQVENRQAFTNYMMKLVSEWNLEELRKEGLENGVIPSYLIVATRIIFREKKYEIDCFYFKNFFNFQRDYVYGFEE